MYDPSHPFPRVVVTDPPMLEGGPQPPTYHPGPRYMAPPATVTTPLPPVAAGGPHPGFPAQATAAQLQHFYAARTTPDARRRIMGLDDAQRRVALLHMLMRMRGQYG